MIYAFLFLNDDSVPSRSFQAYTLIEDRNLFEINDIIGFECAIRTKGINSFIKFALKDSLSNEEISKLSKLINNDKIELLKVHNEIEIFSTEIEKENYSEILDYYCSNMSHKIKNHYEVNKELFDEFMMNKDNNEYIYDNKTNMYTINKYQLNNYFKRFGLDFDETIKKIFSVNTSSNSKKIELEHEGLFLYKDFSLSFREKEALAITEIADELAYPKRVLNLLHYSRKWPEMFKDKKESFYINLDLTLPIKNLNELLDLIQRNFHNQTKTLEELTVTPSKRKEKIAIAKHNIRNVKKLANYLFAYDYNKYCLKKNKTPIKIYNDILSSLVNTGDTSISADSIRKKLLVMENYIDKLSYINLFEKNMEK